MTYKEKQPGTKYAKSTADISDTHTAFKDCTRLIEHDELILDIDNGITVAQTQKILDFLDINTQIVKTTRGVHIYFKKPKFFRTQSKGVTAFGISVEYKDAKNTPNGINLKSDGILREHFNENIYCELPLELKPLKKVNEYDLLAMDEGDGRNTALFKHHKHLGHIENKNQIIKFINNNIFESPLSDEEITNVCKDETGTNITNIFDQIDFLLKKYQTVRFDAMLYMKINGKYMTDEFIAKKQFLLHFPLLKMFEIDEIYRQLLIRSEQHSGMEFPIQINGGYIDKGQYHPYIYDGFTPFYMDIKYNEAAEPNKYIDILIETITEGDKDYKKLLLQIFAYPLILDSDFKTELGKFFFFVGNGKNGKGTVLKLLRAIYGDENTSSIKVHELIDRTKIVSLKNKIINVGDDIENMPLKDNLVATLKNISTADGMATREMYGKTENNTTLFATMIFSSNHILTSFEKGFSYKRRVVWLPMYKRPETLIKNFGALTKTKEAREYLFKLMVESMGELYDNYEFHSCQIVDDFVERYHQENDNIQIYLDMLEDGDYDDVKPKAVYSRYEEWCEEEGFKPMPPNSFKKRIMEEKELEVIIKKVNKRSNRVFAKLTKGD